MTLSEIRAKGLAALARELGPVGYVRFIQQFDAGRGDHTLERREWIQSLSAEELSKSFLDDRKSEH
ncbi:MAG: hypothetical protein JXQ73_27730 [Phycisphaerae bacterium]|nr:hypothetical protein [Phycisphaerae bacterium]